MKALPTNPVTRPDPREVPKDLLLREIHPQISAAPDSPAIEFTASDESIDRYGEVLTAAGWVLDNYRRNPVFLNSHRYDDVIHALGRSTQIEIRDGRLWQRVEFAVEANPVAKLAHALYRGGYLRAVSVGFSPLKWEDADGTEYRRRYTSQELWEVSAVVVPANPNALVNCVRAGHLARVDLDDAHDLVRAINAARIALSAHPDAWDGLPVPPAQRLSPDPAIHDPQGQVVPAAAGTNAGAPDWVSLLERAHAIMRGRPV